MRKLLDELQAKPTVYIVSQLQGVYKDPITGVRTNFKGEDKFKNAEGKVTGVLEFKGERIVGRATIIDVKPSSWTPPEVKK